MNSEKPERAEEKGHSAYQAGDLEEAARHFEIAQKGYVAQENPGKAGEMANNLCVLLLKLDSAEEALSIVRDTPALFEELGLELLAAQAYGNLATALEACGNLADAETAYIMAGDRLADLEEKEAHSLTLKALSQLQLRRGKSFDALSSMQTSLDSTPKAGFRERILKKILDIPSRLFGN